MPVVGPPIGDCSRRNSMLSNVSCEAAVGSIYMRIRVSYQRELKLFKFEVLVRRFLWSPEIPASQPKCNPSQRTLRGQSVEG